MAYNQGFSEDAADAYARMTAASIDGGLDMAENLIRGTTTLESCISDVVVRADKR